MLPRLSPDDAANRGSIYPVSLTERRLRFPLPVGQENLQDIRFSQFGTAVLFAMGMATLLVTVPHVVQWGAQEQMIVALAGAIVAAVKDLKITNWTYEVGVGPTVGKYVVSSPVRVVGAVPEPSVSSFQVMGSPYPAVADFRDMFGYRPVSIDLLPVPFLCCQPPGDICTAGSSPSVVVLPTHPPCQEWRGASVNRARLTSHMNTIAHTIRAPLIPENDD